MIAPHGGRLVDRQVSGSHAEQLYRAVEDGPSIPLNWNHFQEFVNISTGRFSPLTGFMGRNDFRKVIHDMMLEDGTVWPLPIILDVDAALADELTPGEMVGLESSDGKLVGTVEVGEVYKHNKREVIESLFGTDDPNHPGVSHYLDREDFLVGGDVYQFEAYRHNDHDLYPAESRVLFQHRDWDTVVGFQTRNAPHRAHEYIQKSALEGVDGLLIQPKLGEKKVDDYHDQTILGAYEILVKSYYPEKTVTLSVFPSKMRYAGPREALFDALVRKNQGCTHFIVGRDHAGTGDYYDEFGAQQIFDQIGDLGIELIFFDYAFYCHACDGMASTKICPHEDDKRVHPSGTTIRNSIREDERPSESIRIAD